ncbi:MAG: MgtC/SapB family protein [Gemmataceae bacterium]
MADWFRQFWAGFHADFFDLPDGAHVAQIVGRLLVAAAVGGVLGYDREQKGKAAGMRTHMLVALAAAFFVVAGLQAGMTNADLSRVIQGIAAGIGFLGAGTILKQSAERQVHGLTTAASLYLTTAIGVAAGLGRELTVILGTALALAVLALLPHVERRFRGDGPTDDRRTA